MPTDFQRHQVLAILLAAILPSVLAANPRGEAVRHGAVTFERVDGQLRVLQATDKAIIDWESFSIGTGELTQFVQPGTRSAALNRVRGPLASRLDGALRANGQVWLLNPAGIVVGPGGTVDAAGFVASTLDVSDHEFLSGGDIQFRGASQAGVVNLGSISAFEGDVFLIASTVENAGTLRAPQGTVGLAAGNDVLIQESGDERVFVRGASGRHGDGVKNTGSIEANMAELKAHGGNVYAMAIRNEGRVAATGVTRQGGQIFLRAPGGRVQTTGTLQARKTDRSGGRVVVDSTPGGTTEIGGTVDAAGDSGKGGEVQILGQDIQVMPDAVVIANGPAEGGSIFLGGGQRGENAEIPNAQNVTVAEGAKLQANSLGSGPGGRIVVFAEDTLRFNGHASARGGPQGGDGGFVELSGKRHVFLPGLIGHVDVSAPFGRSGALLFDPIDTTILEGSGTPIGGSPVSQNTLYSDDIEAFLAGANLIIETSFSGPDAGDIFVEDNVSIQWSSTNSLTFNAVRDFHLGPGASIKALGSGGITVNAGRSVELVGSNITTTTGGLAITANQLGTATGEASGIHLSGATLSTTSGDIDLFGHGSADSLTGGHSGIQVESASSISSDSGAIILTGIGGAGTLDNQGVWIDASSIGNGTGAIIISGTGSTTATGTGNGGVTISNGARVETDFGDIEVGGIAGSGTGSLAGVSLLDGGTTIYSENGMISLSGTGASDDETGNHGIHLSLGTVETGTGGGKISLIGSGGAGGLFINGGSILTSGGSIDLIGSALAGDNTGVDLSNAQLIGGEGTVLVKGTGSGSGLAISTTGSAALGSGGERLYLESLGGDVTAANAIQVEDLWLRDSSGTDSANFSLLHAQNDVGTIGATGTGSFNAVGSVNFRDRDGFVIAGELEGTPFNVTGNATLLSEATSTDSIEIYSSVASQGGNIKIGGYDIYAFMAGITTSGTGTVELTAESSILLDDTEVSVEDGDLTMNAHTSGSLSGDFTGIVIFGSHLTTSGMGNILLTGSGGHNATEGASGIHILNGSTIRSTSTASPNAGGIHLAGTGGDGAASHAGVWISGSGTLIESASGPIEIEGLAGDASPGHAVGVLVNSGAMVKGDGATISISGTGGGTGSGNIGVYFNDGHVQALGTGTATIEGQGGEGNDQSDGIRLASGASVSVQDGLLSMEGTAGPVLGKGIDVQPGAGSISVTGTGSASLTGSGTGAAGVHLQGGLIGGSAADSVTIQSTSGDLTLASAVIASGSIGLETPTQLLVSATVTSHSASLSLEGNQITINGILSAAHHIGFQINDQGSAASGTIAIHVGFNSSTVQYSGGNGSGDLLTFAGLTGPVTLHGADLEDLEFLVGTSSNGDHFVGRDTPSTYTISGPNAFSVGNLNVTSFEQLTGGAHDDVFEMTGSTPFLTGLLDGGGGSNELSYSGHATGVAVDLAQGTGTGLGSGFVNIGSFTGSAHVDTLTGPGTSSTFDFMGLDNFTVNGGTTVYHFENVIGGPEGDTFRFYSGSGLSGYLNGGLGTNILDYSLFGAPVTVNIGPTPLPALPARYAATGIGGGFVNAKTILGSASAEDLFIGPRNGSTFNITGADAFAVGAFNVTGFENLTGGAGADTFQMGPTGSLRGRLNGGGGNNTLNYSGRGAPVTVNLGAGTATGLGGFQNIRKFIGTSGLDTLIGTSAGDTFNITANNTGNVGGNVQFEAFDLLDGADGNDVFNFLNQAQIGMVLGGNGSDLLFLNDSNLRSGGTYTIGNGVITRNPTYNFGSIETVRLLLGRGNDTVNTQFTGFVQILDGGGGTNALTIGGATPASPSPGVSGNVSFANFATDSQPPADTGDILQLQLDQGLSLNTGNPGGDPFSVTNLFSTQNSQTLTLNSLATLQGGSFASVLAGQAGVLLIDGNSYQLLNAFSLDGLGLTPSNFVTQALGSQLNVSANLELLQALGSLSGLILTLPDGPLAIDLSGQPVPPLSLAALLEQLRASAGIELAQALQMPLAILLTPSDSSLTMDASGQPAPAPILVLLTAQLDAAAQAELAAALGIAPN